jgi:hypothetical protein
MKEACKKEKLQNSVKEDKRNQRKLRCKGVKLVDSI